MATEMTQALLAADGSIYDINYFDLGPVLLMVAQFSSPQTACQYIQPGMVNIVMAVVNGSDGAEELTADSNGMLMVITSGLATGDTGQIMIWGT